MLLHFDLSKNAEEVVAFEATALQYAEDEHPGEGVGISASLREAWKAHHRADPQGACRV